MHERIQKAIQRAGLDQIQADLDTPLEESGLDSLFMALSVAEIEREFKIKIPIQRVDRGSFHSLRTIGELLVELGAST